MNIKKSFIVIFGIMAFLAAIFAVDFYLKYFRGAGPAFGPPAGDITKLIPGSPVPGENTTGMPLKLPPGFSISIFAKDLVGPRVMAFDPNGNLLTSVTGQGKVVALPDANVDGVADAAVIVASGLSQPHGMAFRCEGSAGERQCNLYIAETNQISIYDYDRENLKAINKRKIADLPGGGNHFTRTIGFGPDDRLYISIGSSCNVCVEKDDRRAKIFSMNPDGSDFKEFARGLRNTVFFTWHPASGKIWGSDMGRDFLGDNLPPDEINIIESGKNYGWPNCYGKNIHDADFDKNVYIRNPCMEPFETSSHIDIPAHSAPLGLAFVPKNASLTKSDTKSGAWPEEYRHNLFVAYHGSWNRTAPTGYKIVRYKLDEEDKVLGAEDFIVGWLTEKGALGRPVDILVQSEGMMYVSDDKAGVVYRIVFNG